MTLGKNGDTGEGTISLTADELKALTAGKPVTKQSGDSQGVFTLTVKVTRPRSKAKRFPHGEGS